MFDIKSKHIALGMAGVAVAIILCAVILSWTALKIKSTGDVIEVVGSAKRPVTSDFIVWRGQVSARKSGMQEGYREITHYTQKIRDYFKSNNIPDSLIVFSALNSWPIMEYTERGRETGRILAYNYNQNFEIRSSDVARIAELSQKATELINDGVPLSSYPPEYLFSGLSEMRIDMLAEATQDAKLRADKIAGATGKHVGSIRSAKMGVFQLTSRNSTAVSDYGMYDTSTLEKDLTAVVRVQFSIE